MGTKKVEIELVRNEAGKLEWEISTGWWSSGGPGNYPVIKLDKDDGPDLIVWKIKNPDQNIKFSSTEPIWVQEGSKPLKFAESSQISDPKVMANGKKLVVVDWNNNSGTIDLHYQL